MKKYGFEKLEVWQDSRQLTKEIYFLTRQFPSEERYGLIQQIRRATISISCNLAEGTSRWSNKERIRYIEISYGSLMEVLNCLILSVDLGFLDNKTLIELRGQVDKIANKLSALANAYRSSK